MISFFLDEDKKQVCGGTSLGDGVIFHKIIGVGQKGLWVWRIGTENVSFKYSYSRRNRTMRLKKFTVDPKEAAAYYSKKSGADKAIKSSVIATGRK